MEETSITSKKISDITGIRHGCINRAIRNLIIKVPCSKDWFMESHYLDCYNRKMNTIMCTLEGIKLLLDNKRKSLNLKPLMEWYKSKIDEKVDIVTVYSRFEDSFINKLEQSLEVFDYKLKKQYPLLDDRYRIDGYIERLQIAIEYDEKQHNYNKTDDTKRQKLIETELGCTFVRCDYKNTDAYNIGLVMKEVMRKQSYTY